MVGVMLVVVIMMKAVVMKMMVTMTGPTSGLL